MAPAKSDDESILAVLHARELITRDQHDRLLKAVREGATVTAAMRKTPMVEQADFLVAKSADEAEVARAIAALGGSAARTKSSSKTAVPKTVLPPTVPDTASAPPEPERRTATAHPVANVVPTGQHSDDLAELDDELMDPSEYDHPVDHNNAPTAQESPVALADLDPDLELDSDLELEFDEPSASESAPAPPLSAEDLEDLELPGELELPDDMELPEGLELPGDDGGEPAPAADDSSQIALGGALNSALWEEAEAEPGAAIDSRREVPEGFVPAPEDIDVNELDLGIEAPVAEPAAEPIAGPAAQPAPAASTFAVPASSEGYRSPKGRAKVFTLSDDEGIALIGTVNTIIADALGRSSAAVRFVVRPAGCHLEDVAKSGETSEQRPMPREEIDKLINRIKVMATIQPWKKDDAKGVFRALHQGLEYTGIVEVTGSENDHTVLLYLLEGAV